MQSRPGFRLSLAVSFLCCTLLSGCSDNSPEQADSPISGDLSLPLPEAIPPLCAQHTLNLNLSVSANGDAVEMTPPNNQTGNEQTYWTGTIITPPGQNIEIEANWSSDALALASLSQSIAGISSSFDVQYGEADYQYIDTDGDGHTNVAELCADPASDPDNSTSVPATPPEVTPTGPVDTDPQPSANPQLSIISPQALNLSAMVLATAEADIAFQNTVDDSVLNFTVETDQSWLAVSPQNGALDGQQSQTLAVSATCGDSAETLSGELTISSNGGEAQIPVTLECEQAVAAELGELSIQILQLSAATGQSASDSISFTNTGNADLGFTASWSPGAAIETSVEPDTGTLAPGDSQALAIEAVCGENTGNFSSTLLLQGNFTPDREIAIELECTSTPVFSENGYAPLLKTVVEIANSTPFREYELLAEDMLREIFEEDYDSSFFTETSRESESLEPPDLFNPLTANIGYECNAGGELLAEVADSIVYAEFTDCVAGDSVFNGTISWALVFDAFARGAFIRFDELNRMETTTGKSATLTAALTIGESEGFIGTGGSYRYGREYTEITYAESGSGKTMQISNGRTLAATSFFNQYEMLLEFELSGSPTDNMPVKINMLSPLLATPAEYYNSGAFRIGATEADESLEIDTDTGDPATFMVNIQSQSSTSSVIEPWSSDYYLNCAHFPVQIDDEVYMCP